LFRWTSLLASVIAWWTLLNIFAFLTLGLLAWFRLHSFRRALLDSRRTLSRRGGRNHRCRRRRKRPLLKHRFGSGLQTLGRVRLEDGFLLGKRLSRASVGSLF
jgi:hypothetical protein